ncbi:alpha/beta hydrolase [Algivirga pacifica]|uniref:alpha/beta fold hydrolase n=1 Tax=Algivirga pacifica TaxID=1162670 RepID=UPI0031EDE91D
MEKVSPQLAERWFTKLFTSPFRYPIPEPEKAFFKTVEKEETLNWNGEEVKVYQWGEGKPILMVHGWMGRAGQFRKMIPAFTKEGYKVISFDAIAHGYSTGKSTHMLEFSQTIQELGKQYGPFEAIIGHSLGGVACLHATIVAKLTKKLVMLGSPSVGEDILSDFRKLINASEKNIPYMLERVQDLTGQSFFELSGIALVKQLRGVELLLVHDKQDKQVSFLHSEAVHANYKDSELILTEGLGHNRILKDKEVIKKVFAHAHQETIEA